MAINVSITLAATGRPFYSFGSYTILSTGATVVDLSQFNNAELANLVDSVVGGDLTVAGYTTTTFPAYVGGVVASQSSLIASTASVPAAVLTTPLTGFASASGTVTATDTVLSAFDKVNGNTALVAGLTFTGATVGTTAPAAGAGAALPATPAGYVTVSINGTSHQIAYY
jgi:hypothetical protein